MITLTDEESNQCTKVPETRDTVYCILKTDSFNFTCREQL